MEIQELYNNRLVWQAAQEEKLTNSLDISPDIVLSKGFSHEFFLEDIKRNSNFFPVSVLLPLIKKLLKKEQASFDNRYIVFLGREVWPTPFSLRDVFSKELSLSNFLFIDAISKKSRQRALETLAHSGNVIAVISFLKDVPFPFTQKLHLLAKQSKAYLFIFRDNQESVRKSAAFSRWVISQALSNGEYPSWNLTLQRSKGSGIENCSWRIEGINEEEVSVYLLSKLVSRFDTKDFASSHCA